MQTTKENKITRKMKMNDTDIVSIILADHKPLKKLIKVMKDSDCSAEERLATFEEFAPALIAHAKPEEQTLYVYMKDDEELKEGGYEGEVEHNIADQLLEEIKRTDNEDMKAARIKVLAELVEHHIEEEEEELLPDFKEEAEQDVRSRLGNQFMELKMQYLAAGDENIIPDPKTESLEQDRHW